MRPHDGTPRLSVVMGVLNGARFLDEAVESVLSQDYRHFEFIIVDDGSTDRTPELLARWAARDPRIVLLRNEVNIGHSASLNRGMRQARGEWIARQDADDVSEPGRFSRQIAWIDSHPGVVLVSTGYRVIDERGSLLRNEPRADRPEVVEYFLRFGNAIGGATQVMFRRDDALAVGGFNESYRVSEDYDLWTRLARRGRVAILPFYGMRYRVHPQSATSATRPEERITAVRVVQRELGVLLGRTIEEAEAVAVRVVGGGEFAIGDRQLHAKVGIAARLYAEGYRKLLTAGTGGDVARRVRRRTARRLGSFAMLALLRGEVRACALGFRHALRWSPWSAPAAALGVVSRELLARGRRVASRLWRARARTAALP